MLKKVIKEKQISNQIRLPYLAHEILKTFTKDRSKSKSEFLTDILYFLEEKEESREEVEKFFGNIISKKYFSRSFE